MFNIFLRGGLQIKEGDHWNEVIDTESHDVVNVVNNHKYYLCYTHSVIIIIIRIIIIAEL